MTSTIIRSSRSFRRLRETAREALRAVHALEEAMSETDVFGRYTISADEELDVGEVVDFLQLAKEMHPTQEITLIVTAQPGTDKEEHDGSRTVRHT